GGGNKTVYVRFRDRAHRYFQTSDSIILDETAPSINNLTASPDMFTNSPGGSQTSTNITANISDNYSSGGDLSWTLTIVTGTGNNYVVSNSGDSINVTWNGKDGAGVTLGSGTYNYYVTAADAAGNLATSSTKTVTIDRDPPTGSVIIGTGNPDYCTSQIQHLHLSASDNISGVSHMRLKNDGESWGSWQAYDSLIDWNLRNLDGTRIVYVQYRDALYNESSEYSDSIVLDRVPPSISISNGGAVFNQMYDSVSFNITVDDATGTQIDYKAGIYTADGGTLIKSIKPSYSGYIAEGTYPYSWDGKNDSGDYVNEGTYYIKVWAKDQAGNETDAIETFNAVDDIQITNNGNDSTDPSISLNGSTLTLNWIEGYQSPDQDASITVFAGSTGEDAYVSNWVYINHNNCPAEVETGAWGQSWAEHGIYYVNNYGEYGGTYIGGVDWSGNLSQSWVRVYAAVGSSGGGAQSSTELKYKIRNYLQYSNTSSNLGQSWWGQPSGPVTVQSIPSPVTQLGVTNYYIHKVYVSGGNIYYQRSADWGATWCSGIKITSSSLASNPTIIVDSNDNTYVAWEDNRDGNTEIYFQKVPVNFAPANSTPSLRSMNVEEVVVTATGTLEIIAPKDQDNIKTLRPTFEWYGLQNIRKYKIECNKAGSLSRELTKTFTANEVASVRPNLSYTIHEFDEGLERSTSDTDYLSWKVIAYDESDVATAESSLAEFLIMPDLTISGVTNYPNPFNPNDRTTKIRYKF
ncbi:MAG: hypothetical protein KKF07_04100, partial [Candidatus Margulisbacteria bacterium]|nr:hypothetical protein [Candidatus Margulisiibacteriota bacterium]